MARKKTSDELARWKRDLASSQAAWKIWADKYRIDRAEEFFHGMQWSELGNRDTKYVINLFYPAIKTKQPSLLFYSPHFMVKERPTREGDAQSHAEARAQLREDVLNTLVSDPDLKFSPRTALCTFEALLLYGVMEVGYTADFIDNPNAGQPIFDDDGNEIEGATEPDKVPSSERLFFKRIPAKCFRVPSNGKNSLSENDWVGYYEWHYPADLKANPNYSNTAALQTSGAMANNSPESGYIGIQKDRDDERYRNMVKVWKIWDNRAKERLVFADNGEKFLMRKPFKFLPFSVLKFDEVLDEFYPFPLTFNWIWPQVELNDTREMQRLHRKRARRKFIRTPQLTDEEVAKLEAAEDMTIVTGATLDCIAPIQDAPLDNAVVRNVPLTKADFDEISGTTAEQKGVAESTTATQSNILNTRSMIRESLERREVAEWLADIGLKALMTIEENMALPFWVKTVVDMQSPAGPTIAEEVARTWREITADDLGDISYDVSVDIESLSPATEMQQRQDWNAFMATVMANPALVQVFALSPAILRKTAKLNGIKSEKDLNEIQRVMQVLAASMQQMAQQKAQGAQPAPAPGPTPSTDQIMAQLSQQMPTMQ